MHPCLTGQSLRVLQTVKWARLWGIISSRVLERCLSINIMKIVSGLQREWLSASTAARDSTRRGRDRLFMSLPMRLLFLVFRPIDRFNHAHPRRVQLLIVYARVGEFNTSCESQSLFLVFVALDEHEWKYKQATRTSIKKIENSSRRRRSFWKKREMRSSYRWVTSKCLCYSQLNNPLRKKTWKPARNVAFIFFRGSGWTSVTK